MDLLSCQVSKQSTSFFLIASNGQMDRQTMTTTLVGLAPSTYTFHRCSFSLRMTTVSSNATVARHNVDSNTTVQCPMPALYSTQREYNVTFALYADDIKIYWRNVTFLKP